MPSLLSIFLEVLSHFEQGSDASGNRTYLLQSILVLRYACIIYDSIKCWLDRVQKKNETDRFGVWVCSTVVQVADRLIQFA